MPMPAHEIVALIQAGVPDATVEMRDLAGDDDHWAATVTSPSFRGLSRVKQHKMVFDALGARMGNELHALQLTTREA